MKKSEWRLYISSQILPKSLIKEVINEDMDSENNDIVITAKGIVGSYEDVRNNRDELNKEFEQKGLDPFLTQDISNKDI